MKLIMLCSGEYEEFGVDGLYSMDEPGHDRVKANMEEIAVMRAEPKPARPKAEPGKAQAWTKAMATWHQDQTDRYCRINKLMAETRSLVMAAERLEFIEVCS